MKSRMRELLVDILHFSVLSPGCKQLEKTFLKVIICVSKDGTLLLDSIDVEIDTVVCLISVSNIVISGAVSSLFAIVLSFDFELKM